MKYIDREEENTYSLKGLIWIYNFGTPFLGHHYYILVLGLSDLCLGLEKKIVREIMYSHCITYMAAP